MKYRSILFLLALFLGGSLFGQGIEFFEGTWEEALAKANEEDKVIFVDAYAVWCGPCKRMSKTVFTDESVGTYYNANFINLKIDAEKGMGLEFRQKYPVTAFPTLFYIDPNGKEVQKTTGFRDAPAFIKLGEMALRNYAGNSKYIAIYDEGDRSPNVVYNYLKYKNKSGEPDIKAANEYIRNQENLDSDENLKILFEACLQCDSKIFDLFLERKKKIVQIFGKEKVDHKIARALDATVNRAVMFESIDLLLEAQKKALLADIPDADAFERQSSYTYYKGLQDKDGFWKTAKELVKKEYKKDAIMLMTISSDILTIFSSDREMLLYAAGLSEKAIKLEPAMGAYFLAGKAYYNAGKLEKAKEILNQGAVFAQKNEKQPDGQFLRLLERVDREL